MNEFKENKLRQEQEEDGRAELVMTDGLKDAFTILLYSAIFNKVYTKAQGSDEKQSTNNNVGGAEGEQKEGKCGKCRRYTPIKVSQDI